MSEMLPALIGFVISVAWLLTQLEWHTKIRKWYSQNIDDHQGLVIPSLLVITLPFILSHLWQSDRMKWVHSEGISTKPLGILLTSSLTAIGVFIANSISKEIDKRRDIFNTSKLVYEYMKNKGTRLEIPIKDLESIFRNPIDQISLKSIHVVAKIIFQRVQTDVEGIDKKPIELILEKSTSLHQDLLNRIIQYFDSVNSFASTIKFINKEIEKKANFHADTFDSEYIGILEMAYANAILSYIFSISIRIYLGRYLSKRLYCNFDQNDENILVDELRHQGKLYQKLIDNNKWPFDNPVDKELQFLRIDLQQEELNSKINVQQ